MVHNGIEYALMAAYAEGFNILAHANAGRARARRPTRKPRRSRIPSTINTTSPLPEIAELWRRGSVIGSWLLDLTARALAEHPDLGRSPAACPIPAKGAGPPRRHRTAAPAPVLTAALFQRFSSRGEDDFANRLLSAMRHQFGGHVERSSR